MARQSPIDAFEAKVEKTAEGCWIWIGPRVKNSGQFNHGGRTVSPRRFAYEHFVGAIPPRRLVMVDCGEPWCVNPDHLYASTPEERFWRNVQKGDGCWEWRGTVGVYGYGVIWGGAGRGLLRAPRYSYELHHGPVPEGLFVCHHCDNRLCVRPDHLYAGTLQENVQDAVERGRLARGEAHGQSVLTEDAVAEIRRRLDGGEKGYALAEEFGVAESTISRIRHGVSWTENT